MRKLLRAVLLCLSVAMCFAGIASADQAATTTVTVGAHTSFDRTWNWVVTKTDDSHSSVTIAQNEVFTLGYTITVGNGNPPTTDSNWRVQDGITLDGGGTPFTVNDMGSVTASATQGALTSSAPIEVCSVDPIFANPVSFPFTGTHLLCHYSIPLPNGSVGTVNAKATFSDASSAFGSTPFDFLPGGNLDGTQPTIIAGTVNVVDSQAGTLGTVSAPVNPLHPQVFTYTVTVPSATCGSFDLPNTVDLIDAHTGATVGHASDTVHVTVTCPHVNGCTLTQGYWKTHSVYGPAAKADPTWNLIAPSGPNSPFFLSGQTWLQQFNTSPAGGNAYYILSHQYAAAVLNQLNGASSTAAVDAAMAAAKSFLQTYTPAQAGALAKNSAIRTAAVSNAGVLDNYNSGLVGPGHCSENS